MRTGIVFDIKEFAVHDGPGIRTTVFLKGCPMRCKWCQNPEGQLPEPQIIIQEPRGKRIIGKEYTAKELANLLNCQAEILRANEGGVTFSGGEPLLQADFVVDVINRLDNMHVLLDTAGFSREKDFRRVTKKVDFVFFDLKLINAETHGRWTGVDNGPILRNLRVLSTMGIPFVIRVPLVPGVTDTDENLFAIADTVERLSGLVRVELLPYNKAAGGKYHACGMQFNPGFDESKDSNANTAIFKKVGLPVRVIG